MVHKQTNNKSTVKLVMRMTIMVVDTDRKLGFQIRGVTVSCLG